VMEGGVLLRQRGTSWTNIQTFIVFSHDDDESRSAARKLVTCEIMSVYNNNTRIIFVHF